MRSPSADSNKIAQADINQQTLDYQRIIQDLSISEGRIALEVATGQKTELQGLAATDAARRAQIAQLEQIAAKEQEIARISGDPKKIADAEAFRLKIDELAATTDELGKKINTTFETSFSSAFNSVIDGIKSISDAFKSMINSIERSLSGIASQNIAQALFGGAPGAGGNASGGGLIGSLFGSIGGLLGLSGGGTRLAPGQAGPPANAGSLFGAGAGWLSRLFGPQDLAGVFANGGQTTGSGAYLVGENCPELFRPGVSGTVSPAGSFGGHTINISLGQGTSYTRESANQLAATVARHLSNASTRHN